MRDSKIIARGGILTALSLIILYLTNIIPINKLFLLGIASCIIPLAILLIDLKSAFIIYTAVSILSIFIVPPKGVVVLYITIFGLYGFVKYFVEGHRNIPIEILLKLLYFNVMIFLSYLLYSALFVDVIIMKFSLYIILLILQALFLIYDYTLTIFVAYARKNLVKRFK